MKPKLFLASTLLAAVTGTPGIAQNSDFNLSMLPTIVQRLRR